MTRASKGGETGMNGEQYLGGQFLPNTTLPKQDPKARRTATRKQEIAPYVWDVPATPEARSIYTMIAGASAQWDVYKVSFKPFWPYLSQQDKATQERHTDLINRWNAGERWV